MIGIILSLTLTILNSPFFHLLLLSLHSQLNCTLRYLHYCYSSHFTIFYAITFRFCYVVPVMWDKVLLLCFLNAEY